MEWAKIVADAAKWVIEMIIRYASGDDGPEPRRLVDVLPAQLKSDIEHARQRRILEDEIRAGKS